MPEDGLLYSLSFDCPFAWPANPSYAVGAAKATSSKLAAADATGSAEPSQNNRKLELDGRESSQQLHGMPLDNDSTMNEDEAEDEPWPESLREIYLECLYSCHSTTACSRLLRAFQLSIYGGSTGLSDQQASTAEELIQPLRALFVSLNRIDERWHTEIPNVVASWEKAGTAQVGCDADEGLVEKMQGVLQGSAEDGQHYKDKYESDELVHLKSAFEDWTTKKRGRKQDVKGKGRASTNNTEEEDFVDSPADKPAIGLREWLANLEVLEVQLQILFVLQVLSILPVPPRHSKLTHPSTTWLSSIRGGQTPRKRKLAQPSTPQHNGSGMPKERRGKDRIYKTTAIRLDELTDSLAIHQAVGGIGLSLADLMGDGPAETKTNGGLDELDKYQKFWLEVEEHYAELLPPDMLSGCHSKFFTSTSLDMSLHPPSHRSPHNLSSNQQIQHSPFHHPTPNLQQLARSVQLAQEQAKKDQIPASPTLAKLLASDREREREREERNRQDALMLENIMEGVEGGVDGDDNDEGQDDTSWLMPPALPISMGGTSARSTISTVAAQPPTVKSSVGLVRAKSSSKNMFQARQVEFGRTKSRLLSSAFNGDSVQPRKKKAGFSSMALTSVKSGSVGEGCNLTTEGEERINKRKLSSPKRTTSTGTNSRTLILGTPAKPKPNHSRNGNVSKAKPGNPFSRSKSMPDFATSWETRAVRNDPRASTIEEGEEEEEEEEIRQTYRPSFSHGRPEFGEDEGEEDDWEDMETSFHRQNGSMLLVGETPQKGGA